MSDFGAIIYIDKRDKSCFSEGEFQQIEVICEKLAKENTLTGSLAPYLFSVGKTTSMNGEYRTVNLLLSNYWGTKEDYKWHKEVDGKDMKIIAKTLQPLLPNDYTVKSEFAWW